MACLNVPSIDLVKDRKSRFTQKFQNVQGSCFGQLFPPVLILL